MEGAGAKAAADATRRVAIASFILIDLMDICAIVRHKVEIRDKGNSCERGAEHTYLREFCLGTWFYVEFA